MGYFTTYEIIAMLVVLGWLIFNAGFVAGTVWRRLHQPRQNIDVDCTTPRCRFTSVEDAARHGGV